MQENATDIIQRGIWRRTRRLSTFLAFYPNCHAHLSAMRILYAVSLHPVDPEIGMKHTRLRVFRCGTVIVHRETWQPTCQDYFPNTLNPSTTVSLFIFDRINFPLPFEHHSMKNRFSPEPRFPRSNWLPLCSVSFVKMSYLTLLARCDAKLYYLFWYNNGHFSCIYTAMRESPPWNRFRVTEMFSSARIRIFALCS